RRPDLARRAGYHRRDHHPSAVGSTDPGSGHDARRTGTVIATCFTVPPPGIRCSGQSPDSAPHSYNCRILLILHTKFTQPSPQNPCIDGALSVFSIATQHASPPYALPEGLHENP